MTDIYLNNTKVQDITNLAFAKDLPADMPRTMSAFLVMDPRIGDLKIIWDRLKADEVAEAERTFNNLIKKGYAAFLVKDGDGSKGEKITKFDPNAERLIMVGPMQGG